MKRFIILFLFSGFLFIVPGTQNYTRADQNYTGTCCTQEGAICNAGGDDFTDMYYKAGGPCPHKEME